MSTAKLGYNERLFDGSGLRRYYHLARFNWFRELCEQGIIETTSLLEVGCFDGRLLDYCAVPPEEYLGIDANWEGGLDLARRRQRESETRIRWVESRDPQTLSEIPSGSFRTGAALETIEHLPPEKVDSYLLQLARIIQGHLVVTVPNEKGLLFLVKYLTKRVAFRGGEHYRLSEVIAATMGNLETVERHDHKGFDYEKLIEQVQHYFVVEKIVGLPLRSLAPSANLTIGILAHPKR